MGALFNANKIIDQNERDLEAKTLKINKLYSELTEAKHQHTLDQVEINRLEGQFRAASEQLRQKMIDIGLLNDHVDAQEAQIDTLLNQRSAIWSDAAKASGKYHSSVRAGDLLTAGAGIACGFLGGPIGSVACAGVAQVAAEAFITEKVPVNPYLSNEIRTQENNYGEWGDTGEYGGDY